MANDVEERWRARYRAARTSLPQWAELAPERCLYVSNATGVFEVYAWDRATDEHRQVTDRAEGTRNAALDPTGEWVWWFDDTAGDEFGRWRRQPFTGGPDEDAAPGLDAAYPSGLAFGRRGTVAIGRTTDEGSTVDLCRPGQQPTTLYAHRESAGVVDVSRDESFVVVSHSEHGDSRHPALRAVRPDGTVVADLWDGPGKGLHGLGFAPLVGDTRLLALHERRDRPLPLIWDLATGDQHEIDVDLPGEVYADWYADGRALLVLHQHRARGELYRYDLDSGRLSALPTPTGSVLAATARPEGEVEFLWSSAAQPPVVRSAAGETVLVPPGDPAPPSVPVEDLDVEGPAGKVHALLSRPEGVAPPYPGIFLVHGGPTAHDADAFHPDEAAWVDAGFAVVRVNYRGSDGYGTAWRDALQGRVGLTELEDIAAVRDHGVRSGLLDADRLVLSGASWGGYLTLLGVGAQPDAWSLGIAVVPVADYVAAYDDEMEGLRAFDRSLFGGSPDQVPERYRESSPITYVDDVRVPLLVLAGANDPRCPVRQIDNYLAKLSHRGHPHEVYRYDAGHGSLVVEERIRQTAVQLDFAHRHLADRTGPSG
jgi:dienelactone hydrolase